MCEDVMYMLNIMMNEQNAQKSKEVAKEYSQQSIQLPNIYAATQVTFSRALGINYTNAASFTSAYTYLGKGKAVMEYLPVVQPNLVNNKLEYKRQNLFGEIARLKLDYQTNTIGYH